MLLDATFLIGGLLILFLGGNFLVKSSVSLAKHLKVSDFLIGIVIVSLGTSFPELIVSVNAAISNHNDISIGNVVGSNIINVLLGIGIASFIFPIVIKKKNITLDLIIMIIATIILFVLTLDKKLNRIDGLIFITFFVIYIIFSIFKDKKHIGEIQSPKYGKFLSVVVIILSAFSLWLGSEGIIKGGSNIAKAMGISERIISLTIIAFGTSLPEIATSITALYNKEPEITLGNIIGSNIFNILFILGTTATIHAIEINEKILSYDYIWLGITSLILIPYIYLIKNKREIRRISALYLVIYLFYLIFLIYNK